MTGQKELEGKVAFVTGGSGGIGQAILRALLEAGAAPVCFDPAACSVEGVDCITGDVADDDSVAAAITQVTEKHGRLDLLIHAAGITRDAVVWKVPLEDWDRVLAVNLRGAFLLLRHAVPAMRENGGRVVLIGSINGSRGKFGTAPYSASKAGLLGLGKTVAREVARFGILVNVVEPGWVRTPLTEAAPPSELEAAEAESLLGRALEPEEVAAAVRFLCGPGARGMTGQVLRVDGGQFLGHG